MWRRSCLVSAVAAVVMCPILVRAGDDAGDEGPASLRDPSFWPGRLVVQTRGWVLSPGDDDHIIRKEYWVLAPAAVGRVTAVRADGTAEVEFANGTGWDRRGFEEREVRTQRWDAEVDQYGRPVAVRMRETIREGLQVEPGDHGHLLEVDEQSGRRTVRFPLNCLGLAPPPRGARVVPGPDMKPLEARQLAHVAGTVVEARDGDHYLRVRWDDTVRDKVYRFDKQRYYDVVPATTLNEAPSSR